MKDKINTYKILAGKPERKRPRTRPSRKLGNNIKMDLKSYDVRVWTRFI
jgi:hypothetical protein